jgi:hypothetical protein
MARADYQCCAKCAQKIVYAGTTEYRDDNCLCGVCAKELESQRAALESRLSEAEARYQSHMNGSAYDRIAALEAKLDEAKRVAVWAARHHASYHADKPIGRVDYWIDWDAGTQDEEECDGTDADIYRALREAEGSSDGK